MMLRQIGRWIYRCVDRTIWSRFSLPVQRRSKTWVIDLAHRITRGHIPRFPVEALLSQPHGSARAPLPGWLYNDMADAARAGVPELDPALFLARKPQDASAPVYRTDAGQAFVSLRGQLSEGLDTLFLVPRIGPDALDLGVLHLVRACVDSFGHSVAVMSTEPQGSQPAACLPHGTRHIDAGAVLAPLDVLRGEQVLVLGRLLLQVRPRRIHVLNSRLGWQLIQHHASALRQFARLYASVCCDERDGSNCTTGWVAEYLQKNAGNLDGIIVDSSHIPPQWEQLHAVKSLRFSVVDIPTQDAALLTPASVKDSGAHPQLPGAQIQRHIDPLMRCQWRDFVHALEKVPFYSNSMVSGDIA